jgi:hypothetical protein
VPLDLVISDRGRWVSRAVLRADPRLADLEVFRQPQAPNPSFFTVAQFAILQEYVSWAPSHRARLDRAGTGMPRR